MNDFLDFLYQHIPHRWLNQKAKGTKRLFEGLAKSVKYVYDYVNMLERNNHTRTADEIITELENEYGITVNPSYDLDFRRERIIAKIRMQDSPITERQLVSILEMMGFFDVQILPELGKFIMHIRMQMPQECGYKAYEIQKMLHENIRAHIGMGMIYVLPTLETNIPVGTMVQQSVFVDILPDTEYDDWESECVIDTGGKSYVGAYVEVYHDTDRKRECEVVVVADGKSYVGAYIEIEEE